MLEGPLTWKLWILQGSTEDKEILNFVHPAAVVLGGGFLPHVLGMASLSCRGELEAVTDGSKKDAAVRRCWKQEHGLHMTSLAV